MSFLMIIAVLLGILVTARLLNVVQLASNLSGEDKEETQRRHDLWNGIGLMVFMVVGLALMIYMTIKYQPFMLPEAASIHGKETDFLLNINFLVIGIVFFATQIALFWFVYKYRFSPSKRAYFYPENIKLEMIWTIIPTIVLSALIITGLASWNKITKAVDKTDGLNIQVYGYQFGWITRYPGDDNTLGDSYYRRIADDNPLGIDVTDPASADDIMTSGNEMYLPVGRPLLFHFNSRDVLHSAYFPHFRAQMNCVPGMTTKFYMELTTTTAQMREITGDENFDYILVCNKICGVAHYAMKMKIVVVEQDEYDEWLKTQRPIIAVPEAEVQEVAGEETEVTEEEAEGENEEEVIAEAI